ncbi:MAG TPA: hemerythrin domain-containing protein [Bryobacteraceae bacterium]|nr:hemerythrin domain-containing protein [Bryobacteraceae bacterium]
MSGRLLAHRRSFLGGMAAVGSGAIFAERPFWGNPGPREGEAKRGNKEEEVSPNEDLMREHGVLVRCLVIYREVIRRLDASQDFPPDVVVGTANLIRTFVEDYHEKLEEEYLFPRFRKAGRLVDLVNVLDNQHQKGRIVTDKILQAPKIKTSKETFRGYLDMFVRMYEPHEAREDTVLFPEFRKIVSPHEYDALGEEFEKKENHLFGTDGFEKNVSRVADLEKRLGIYDLAKFTPEV